jgi:hypothetical protein
MKGEKELPLLVWEKEAPFPVKAGLSKVFFAQVVFMHEVANLT